MLSAMTIAARNGAYTSSALKWRRIVSKADAPDEEMLLCWSDLIYLNKGHMRKYTRPALMCTSFLQSF